MSTTIDSTADFTVRDLNRQPAEVLAACDRLGVVVIRSRKGDTYELRRAKPKKAPGAKKPAYPDFAARRKAAGIPMMTKEQREHLDRMIGGE